MTKRIREFKIGGNIYFEFENLNYYEDISLLSYLIVHEMGAEVIDSFVGVWYLWRTFKKDALEFGLLVSDNYDGPCLKLLEQDPKDNNELRQLAHEVLDLVRAKSKYFTSRKKRQRLLFEFRFPIEKKEEREALK